MINLKGTNSEATILIDHVDENVVNMVQTILDHPACTNPVKIQADTHLGKGIVIGFTMEMIEKIVPSWIGVDINCAINGINLGKIDNINMEELDTYIRSKVPCGRNIHNRPVIDFDNDFDWNNVNSIGKDFAIKYKEKFGKDINIQNYNQKWFKNKCKEIKANMDKVKRSIGTLGGGNHFISLERSIETGDVWLLIHTGSRNFGKRICDYHEKVAENTFKHKKDVLLKGKIEEILKDDSNNKNRSVLMANVKTEFGSNSEVTGVEYLENDDAVNYLQDMIFTQEYANFNREVIANKIIDYFKVEPKEIIKTNHNFIDFNDWIIRKGAIRSYANEKMIIPFNMKDGSLIVEGKSNPDFNFSAPHGAGRLFSRTKAKKNLSFEKFKTEMTGIFSTSVCEETLDESPMAYKDPDFIEESIKGTCKILDHVKPIYNMKSLD